MFVPSRRRRRRGPDPHLEIKMVLFSLGAALALGGMFLANRWLVGAAIVVLAAGFVLQFWRGAVAGGHRADNEDERQDDRESEGRTLPPG